ncbi:MAG: cytochrome-c oxidase, cbb3-type subunit I [Planctomycetota bacterium]
MTAALEKFEYDDAIVRKFLFATIIWGIVGMLVGLLVALQLAHPVFNLFGSEYLTFGRLRPLHTNAIIFAFAGNAIFCGIYYSTQRLLKARLASNALSNFHFWGWQGIIVSAALTLPLGITQSKEYAELEWPIDIAIAVVWVAFAINFFWTIAKRRERHIYVAIWFYIATIITVAILHIFNNLVVPAGLFRSYSIYAGVQDAFMQWWYGHNAVAFFLTTPFLGLMYYFMPKAADRPVYSYKLSILHFWSLIFIYIWAGPHHLHYTSLASWASTLGMLFSVMLWMPSWGGMINGLLTLRGAWHKVSADPILKFFVVAITFYGMSTFEGPLLSVKTVNMLSHYTDWTIAHVHSGGLGWNGFMTFGMIYWLLPRVFQTEIYNRRWLELHFWIGTIGILLYIIPIYVAGVTQGLMWSALDERGTLSYDFVQTTEKIRFMYWGRVIGGLMYFAGAVLCLLNVILTWKKRPATYATEVHSAPALEPTYAEPPRAPSPLEASKSPVIDLAYKLEYLILAPWHRRWERKPLLFTVMVVVAVGSASIFEILPTFLIKSNVPTIASVAPYTPLELAGRDIYIQNGCYNCHSQQIRPIYHETKRYGEYSKAGEFVYDHPFQWGSRRIGPDLHRVGGDWGNLWHYLHMENPQLTNEKSIMPRYPYLLEKSIDFADIQRTVNAMSKLGVPYDEELRNAPEMARLQARAIAEDIQTASAVSGAGGLNADSIADKQIIALVAYLQRLGTDLTRTVETASAAPPSDAAPGTPGKSPGSGR